MRFSRGLRMNRSTTGCGREGMSSLGGRILVIDQILTHTHTTHTQSQYDEQIPMIYGE